MKRGVDRVDTAILRVLDQADGVAAGAAKIGESLAGLGVILKPRAVRFRLARLDAVGLTRLVSRRRGRVITELGKRELSHVRVVEKVGFVAARVDVLGYRMSFDVQSGTGSITANVAVIPERDLSRSLVHVAPVFAARLGMGVRLALARAGDEIAGVHVQPGKVALGTVCSIAVNGVLLREGVPVVSRFGGLVELRQGVPIHFVELIEYRGTTIDPLEAFIKAGMTSVAQCAETGSGIVGASFREIPSAAVERVKQVQGRMKRWGLSGILAIGKPNQPLLDIPVSEGRSGMIVIGGMNPFAAMFEAGIPLTIESLAGLEDMGSFREYEEIARKGRRPRYLVD